jgi:hypothetical protein
MAPPLYRPERYQGSARRRPCFESWHWKQVMAEKDSQHLGEGRSSTRSRRWSSSPFSKWNPP